ncbi:hypothetical protein BGZ79_007448 [Entomortierella chlamydospora]|nr:hypothetical protein BGZ79_007448 [Entomortierella chlamydospora]
MSHMATNRSLVILDEFGKGTTSTGLYLSKLFQRYETIVPMLTEHEKSMQKMYEQLTSMILSLDLDRDIIENKELTTAAPNREGSHSIHQQADFADPNGSTSDVVAINKGNTVNGKMSNIETGGKPQNREEQGELLCDDGDDGGDDDGNYGGSGNEDSWYKAIDQLLRFAAKVDRKEREAEQG